MQRVSTAGSRRAATAVLLLAAVFAFSFSTVSAHPHPHHSRNPDKVRALVATDTPDPVEAPGFSVLSLQAAVRRVDGLKADDDDDRHEDHDNRKSQTTFVLRCFWTISSGSTIVRQLVREVEIQPPFATVKLANRHGRGTKSFARVDATTSWDLKSASGVLVDAGVYNYQVFAEFIRIRTKKGKVKEKEIDDSETLSGTITVRKAPPPVITVTSPQDGALTRESFVTVSGSVTGQDPLSVSVNSQAVALTNGTFSYPLALPEGSTTITAVVTDGIGRSDQKVVTAIRGSQSHDHLARHGECPADRLADPCCDLLRPGALVEPGSHEL